MNAVFAVARADFRERTRTFTLLVVIAALLQLGYLWVPDASAAYSTVDLGGWRGIYDSAWMGTTTAVLITFILPMFGFFLVRPAFSRDARLGTYEIVAAAPLARSAVVFAKWLSNVALLMAFAAVLTGAAIAMQLLRGEDRNVDITAYLVPLIVAGLPVCALTATAAIVFSAVRPLRGIAGGVAWIFAWEALLATPMLVTHGTSVAAVDPLGVTALIAALFSGLHGVLPSANTDASIAIGVSDRSTHVFRFPGVSWTPGMVAVRAAWLAVAAAFAWAVAPFGIAAPRSIAKPRRFAMLPARIASRLPLPRLTRAELAAALGAAGPWWLFGAVGLAVAALLVPAEILARGVAPLIWIWPVGPTAAASVLDARANLDGVLLATATPTWRRIVARWLACVALAGLPIVALALRAGPPGLATIAIACAVAAVAVFAGTLTRSAVAFEVLALCVWYLGPVNRLPLLDPNFANAHAAPATAIAAALVLSALGGAAAYGARRS